MTITHKRSLSLYLSLTLIFTLIGFSNSALAAELDSSIVADYSGGAIQKTFGTSITEKVSPPGWGITTPIVSLTWAGLDKGDYVAVLELTPGKYQTDTKVAEPLLSIEYHFRKRGGVAGYYYKKVSKKGLHSYKVKPNSYASHPFVLPDLEFSDVTALHAQGYKQYKIIVRLHAHSSYYRDGPTSFTGFPPYR